MDKTELKRPGGELASRPLHFFWLVDCSGSMYGSKIDALNNAIQETIPDMKDAADNNPSAQLLVRAIRFSSGAEWINSTPTPIENYSWEALEAGGITDMGEAFELLAEQLTIPPMTDRALRPVIVLLSDGEPTDDYEKPLQQLLNLPWGKKSVRIAIAIGDDVDNNMLEEFTGNKELVLTATNSKTLTKMIKWASTVASQVSAPASKANPSGKDNDVSDVIDLDNIPDSDENDDKVW